ncbi:hypothetical protein Misp02_38310 [Microtetraspora sp. NBRC 16547]|nr:hypothetical protein Misp02_38310 [Microtetraspora sp. NBRC 16547]
MACIAPHRISPDKTHIPPHIPLHIAPHIPLHIAPHIAPHVTTGTATLALPSRGQSSVYARR